MPNEIRLRPEGAILRTYLAAAGVAPHSLAKPLIGVVTAATQIFSEKPDAHELGSKVVSGIEAAGGIAVRWDTLRSPDLMAWGHADGYSFAWRDQLADLIESWARQQTVDGLALVGDAPETLIGMTMAAARLNLPAILITAGANRWEYRQAKNGEANGAKKKDPGDPFELISETLFGKKKIGDEARANQFNACLLAQDNHASHAVDLALEALGVTLPGMSTALRQSGRRQELATQSGQRIVALVQAGHSLRRVLSLNAFSNAIRLNAALGGSVDMAVHLMALAHEAGVSLPLELFDRIGRETPQVCRLRGKEESHCIEDLDKAGGVWAILHAFKSDILPTTTISGKGAFELAKAASIKDSRVILAHKPYHRQGGVGMLRGSLASRGAVFLWNQVFSGLAHIKGPAVVFESEIEATQAVSRGFVKKGSILVVRRQGPKGGPGLLKLRILPALLESRGLNKTIAVVTDGRLPDHPVGLFVSLVSPESVVPGPLGVLKNGDIIEIDTVTRQLNVRLTDMEVRLRLTRWQAPEPRAKGGFLERYSRSVSEVYEGAVLK